MPTPRIVCVTPTCRPDSHTAFVKAWGPLFEKHNVTLVTVWDGEEPRVRVGQFGGHEWPGDTNNPNVLQAHLFSVHRDLFCRRTDACRNIGFVYAAKFLDPTHVLTLDDDCHPVFHKPGGFSVPRLGIYETHPDPIQTHLDALDRRVPLPWMNTAHDTDLYLRGVPYGVRDEAPVMLSHGVWVGTPDFDGETQLRLEEGRTCNRCDGMGMVVESVAGAGVVSTRPAYPPTNRGYKCAQCSGSGKVAAGVPYSLPYYVGPIPRGVNFPLCGMNVMVTREALPYLYYAPMGADSGVPDLHRFADIFMGVFLKREFDRLGWGVVTGYSTIHHTRASDARKNFEQEKLGREWMEQLQAWTDEDHPHLGFDPQFVPYFRSYADKRRRYADLVAGLLHKDG